MDDNNLREPQEPVALGEDAAAAFDEPEAGQPPKPEIVPITPVKMNKGTEIFLLIVVLLAAAGIITVQIFKLKAML